MAYDKESKTITTNGDRKKFETDLHKHFENVLQELSKDPNCPPEIKQQHTQYQRANKALENAENLKSALGITPEQAKPKNRSQAPSLLNRHLLFDADDIYHLDAMRSMSIGLALFFIAVGAYLILSDGENGHWMALAGFVCCFVAWDAHKALKVTEDPHTLRRKMGYD